MQYNRSAKEWLIHLQRLKLKVSRKWGRQTYDNFFKTRRLCDLRVVGLRVDCFDDCFSNVLAFEKCVESVAHILDANVHRLSNLELALNNN